MLVLTRRVGEKIYIGEHITLMVTRIKDGKVSIGFDAPKDIRIWREELTPDHESSDNRSA